MHDFGPACDFVVIFFVIFFVWTWRTICGMTIKKSIPILDRSIAVCGGVGALAGELGVRQSAVSNWKKRGLPMSVYADLVRRYGRRKPPQRKPTA